MAGVGGREAGRQDSPGDGGPAEAELHGWVGAGAVVGWVSLSGLSVHEGPAAAAASRNGG